jgi:long-chain acyl-CoA synthetase
MTAERFPDRPAFLYPAEMTFTQFKEQVDKFATALADLGVKKGDKVALFGPNLIQWEIACYGISKAGAILVPLSPLFTPGEVEYELNDSGAETVIVFQLMYPTLKAVEGKVKLRNVIVIEFGEKIEGTLGFSELMEKTKPNPPKYTYNAKEDLTTIVYTAGTTGLPKGAMLTNYNVVSNVIQINPVFDVNETDVCMAVLPLFHIYGMTCCQHAAIWSGAAQVVMPRFDPEEWCKLVDKYKVTYSLCAPPIFIAIVRHLENPEVKGYDWSHLKVINNGAGPIPLEIITKCGELATEKCNAKELIVQHGWGLTEASPVIAVNPMHRRKLECQGILIADTEHKVIDLETKQELKEPGQVGELIVRGPQVMKGYWNRPQETEAAFWTDPETGKKWLRTGDVAFIDEEGYEHLVDRLKEMIKYKGWSIAPAELEDLLFKNPYVFDAAVIGKPSTEPGVGETPKAFIVLRPEYKGKVTEQQIVDWVAENISAYKKLREVEFVDSIAKTITGKILRRVLIAEERKKLGLA